MWWGCDSVMFILGRQLTHHLDLCDPALTHAGLGFIVVGDTYKVTVIRKSND